MSGKMSAVIRGKTIPILITKSKSDLKEYKILNLDSGLEVLLVDSSKLAESRKNSLGAQATSSTAAAAMFVSVGSFADPAEAEGCAHFLEHMIFMGVNSPKYPHDENLYDSFVSSHGGSCNAFTEGEHTVYQFDIAEEHFSAALDIFACCFKSPRLANTSSDREIKSIESEFCLAKVSDGTRLQQLMCDSATNGHVLRKFSWGNMKSLSTVPKSKNINTHRILTAFYKMHYVPSGMKLVVMAPKSLEELESEVISSFGDWKLHKGPSVPPEDIVGKGDGMKAKRKRKAAKVGPVELRSLEDCISKFRSISPFPQHSCTYISRVIPVKRAHKLIMTWWMPPSIHEYKTKPGSYLSHLIGHEGPGSLLTALKVRSSLKANS
jgi:nardilysin